VKLNVLKKNQQIQEIDLGLEVLQGNSIETSFLVGRSKDCHVVLDDKQISREHLKISHRSGQWSIELLAQDSLPLILDGNEILKSHLSDGDIVSLGLFQIQFNLNKKTAEVPLEEKQNEVTISPKELPLKRAIEETSEIEPPSDLNAVNIEQSSEKAEVENHEIIKNESTDDFLDHENKEEYPESSDIDLVGNGLLTVDENSNSPIDENTENGSANSYSLENIDTDDGNEATQVIQNFAMAHLELFGEYIPYDKFILEKEKTFIGRDPAKCQIVLNDPEVSSVHAVVTKNNLTLILEDLRSGNGTLLNGVKINKSNLSHNDEFVIGGTSFTVKVRSQFLKEEQNTLMPVDEDQSMEIEEIIEIPAEEGETVNALGEIEAAAPPEKSIIKRIWKNDENRKKLIYGLVVIVLAWVFFDKDKPKTEPKKNVETVKKTDDAKKPNPNDKNQKNRPLTSEEERKFSEIFLLGKNHFDNGRYREALELFEQIATVAPNYHNVLQNLISTAKEGLKRLEEIEKKRLQEIAMAEKRAKIKEYLEKAKKYTDERSMDLAEEWFQKIIELDPENLEVSRMRRDLELWDKEQKRKELDENQKRKDRETKIEKLKPGKGYFLQREWYKAIIKLDEFIKLNGMDEDLLKEATEMLKTSRDELSAAITPLVGKAKSLQEGQDFKGAYEVYQQILKIEPSNSDALNQSNSIKEQLMIRARKVYREAIIAESLSLFQDAKEKFQEVQQISPVDSEYYKKASDKLKDYLE
jgi:pSer/pThr/pTyr-binding forkhead associated (FHA) protein